MPRFLLQDRLMLKYNRYKNVRLNMETGVVERLQEIETGRYLFGLIRAKKKVWHVVDYKSTFKTKDARPCPEEKRAGFLKLTY